MTVLSVRNVHKAYDSANVLAGVTFSLARGEKVALVGLNGVGKTTLLRIIAGVEEPDAGSVELVGGAQIGYLPQRIEIEGEETVIGYLRRVTGVEELSQEMKKLEGNLTEERMERYAEVQEQFRYLHGYAFDQRAIVLLEGFGLDESVIQQSVANLSGGQKTKVALIGVLLKGVDLLLLDEPTNNLDFSALEWLEYYLKETEVACIVVSHDRRFLERTISKVFEIDWSTRTIKCHSGTYTKYLDLKRKQLQEERERYQLQQEEIKRLTKSARGKRAQARKGAQWSGSDNDKMLRGFKRDRAAHSDRAAKAIERRIEQMEKVEKPSERERFVIPLEPVAGQNRQYISLRGVVAGYPDGFRIGPATLDIAYGERVAILGPNGSGKTTLLKTIVGRLEPLQGEVNIGSSFVVGNVTQEHEDLPLDKSLLDFLQEQGGADLQGAYHLLDRFGFEEYEGKKLIGELSLGGRVRLLFALFSARSANVLVLDEPTNHLDVEGVDALEAVLKTYTGTVILVSHDRYLLEKSNLSFVYEISGEEVKQSSLEKYNPPAVKEKMRRLIKRLRV